MKFGKIIMDATSEEAKALMRKKVVASSNFFVIQNRPEEIETCFLDGIDYRDNEPFKVLYEDWNASWHTFIREVIK